MSIIFFLLGVQDIVCFSAASASFLISVAVPCETPMALHLTLRGHEDKQRFMLFLFFSHIYISPHLTLAFAPRHCGAFSLHTVSHAGLRMCRRTATYGRTASSSTSFGWQKPLPAVFHCGGAKIPPPQLRGPGFVAEEHDKPRLRTVTK